MDEHAEKDELIVVKSRKTIPVQLPGRLHHRINFGHTFPLLRCDIEFSTKRYSRRNNADD